VNVKPVYVSVGILAALAGGYFAGRYTADSRQAPAVVQQAQDAKPQERKILYYRNPMGLPETSPVPKKDPMGMDYVPVYEGEAADSPGTVKISVEKVQKLGVRTEQVKRRELIRTVRAVGTIQVDERGLYTVAPKFEGWIERLYVNTTGQAVAKGQPLMDVYSPELVSAQREYLITYAGKQALSSGTAEAQTGVKELADAALQRLRYWDISDAQLTRLQQQGEPRRTLTLTAPASGVIIEKPSVAGMRFMPGEPLYRIANLDNVWLIAEVFEQDLGLVHVGQKAQLMVNAYPDKTFPGKVTFIYPMLTSETRTAKVRIELPNPKGDLKPAMFGTVELAAGHGQRDALTVPDSAVIDSGTRQLVLVQRGEGHYEPRSVKLGMRGDGYIEIREGVREGEQVVVSANFLIDAESNLKAALGSFGHRAHAGTAGNQEETKGMPAPMPTAPPDASKPADTHKGH
jgi:Cu(I)/Ag(I) efflux system membrane fusion protein